MNGQTRLETSAGRDPARFTVSVERTVNLGNYESIRVGLAESFDTSADKDQAYHSVLTKVDSRTSGMKPLTSPPGKVKPAGLTVDALHERLAGWLQDLEILDGFDGFSVKPRRYLGQTWQNVNDVVRSLGGHWNRGKGPGDGYWRITRT